MAAGDRDTLVIETATVRIFGLERAGKIEIESRRVTAKAARCSFCARRTLRSAGMGESGGTWRYARMSIRDRWKDGVAPPLVLADVCSQPDEPLPPGVVRVPSEPPPPIPPKVATFRFHKEADTLPWRRE